MDSYWIGSIIVFIIGLLIMRKNDSPYTDILLIIIMSLCWPVFAIACVGYLINEVLS